MLLPSAFSCDSSQPPLTRLQSALFASPPASPPQLSTQTAVGNIFTTCRSLQALLAAPAPPPVNVAPITPPASSHAHAYGQQLPTPPMAHAPSPLKLRLRSRKTEGQQPGGADHGPARKRIVKRSAPPRGVNKRRRALDDDMGRDDEDGLESEPEHEYGQNKENVDDDSEILPSRPQTPKRSRIAPEIIPLGLERSDYHVLHHADGALRDDSRSGNGNGMTEGADGVLEADGELWSTEEDRILVELVLEKLKLTKSDWQDCARSLGKDRGSVGRRWKSLMVNGDVGLKRSSRRKIYGTWR
ncbi:hypothetical protein B0T26DRAFT_658457 [Lasiosphaeria miniovina]|uniref:Myb-like domain-containing protein n=1 Tax=Lasiosphaeria miniovina TaxID=1954250 RepID=A0AA39ZUC7_9PEZI|nr:uncharacterized protein B0T26DRAFT_658457 [Lasiosphaeria miniovina]KAK0703813.1 hypothetical protein B0T26DRAFT_658457 [Lasiosphaeria miniovina]